MVEQDKTTPSLNSDEEIFLLCHVMFFLVFFFFFQSLAFRRHSIAEKQVKYARDDLSTATGPVSPLPTRSFVLLLLVDTNRRENSNRLSKTQLGMVYSLLTDGLLQWEFTLLLQFAYESWSRLHQLQRFN